MKKTQVDEILVDQAKRRKVIISYSLSIFILFIIAAAFAFFFYDKNKTYYVTYNERSTLDYRVYLKNNSFFENDYLEKDNQYIASLIDYIEADFNYKLGVNEENVDYKYSYRIEAEVNVIDLFTKNSLYSFKKDILDDKKTYSNSKKDVSIYEKVQIDYNYYNDIIKKFVNVYELEDVESTLTINMYVDVLGSCEESINKSNKTSVISLDIPLTTKTVAIDMSSDVTNTNDNLMACKKSGNYLYALIVSIIIFIAVIILLVRLIKFIIDTRTAENIYEMELKKILNNYRSYIQKVNNNLNLRGYQVLKVDSFNDMLEIRDTLQSPILMLEDKDKEGVYFLIPSNTKIVYTYGIKVSDIKKKMKGKVKNEK